MPMAAPARAAKISWRDCYKRPNGRVSRWTDLQTFNAAPWGMTLHFGLPPITDRCESLHCGRSRLCFKRPLLGPRSHYFANPLVADQSRCKKIATLCVLP